MKATGMKSHQTSLSRHWHTIIIVLAISTALPAAPSALAQTVTCDEETLSVNAADIKAEDLIKAIGNECGIKMVLRGEIFTEDVFSVRFENMSIRTGLERILRVVNIPNHMMHFEESSGRTRVIEVNLIGKKGGERQLTPGADRASPPSRTTAEKLPVGNEKTDPGQQQNNEQLEKLMTLLEETVESQHENDEKPNRDDVRERLQQALPPQMQDQIPEKILERLEQLTSD